MLHTRAYYLALKKQGDLVTCHTQRLSGGFQGLGKGGNGEFLFDRYRVFSLARRESSRGLLHNSVDAVDATRLYT